MVEEAGEPQGQEQEQEMEEGQEAPPRQMTSQELQDSLRSGQQQSALGSIMAAQIPGKLLKANIVKGIKSGALKPIEFQGPNGRELGFSGSERQLNQIKKQFEGTGQKVTEAHTVDGERVLRVNEVAPEPKLKMGFEAKTNAAGKEIVSVDFEIKGGAKATAADATKAAQQAETVVKQLEAKGIKATSQLKEGKYTVEVAAESAQKFKQMGRLPLKDVRLGTSTGIPQSAKFESLLKTTKATPVEVHNKFVNGSEQVKGVGFTGTPEQLAQIKSQANKAGIGFSETTIAGTDKKVIRFDNAEQVKPIMREPKISVPTQETQAQAVQNRIESDARTAKFTKAAAEVRQPNKFKMATIGDQKKAVFVVNGNDAERAAQLGALKEKLAANGIKAEVSERINPTTNEKTTVVKTEHAPNAKTDAALGDIGKEFQQKANYKVVKAAIVEPNIPQKGFNTKVTASGREVVSLDMGPKTPSGDITKAQAVKANQVIKGLEKHGIPASKKIVDGRLTVEIENVAAFNDKAINNAAAKSMRASFEKAGIKVSADHQHPQQVLDAAIKQDGVKALQAIKGDKGLSKTIGAANIDPKVKTTVGAQLPGRFSQARVATTMQRAGGGMSLVCGGMQLAAGIQSGDAGHIVLGSANTAMGAALIANTTTKGAAVMSKVGLGSKALGRIAVPLAVASVAYDVYKEEGSGVPNANDKTGYKIARGAVGAASIAGGIGASVAAGAAVGTLIPVPGVGTAVGAVAGLVVGLGIAYFGGKAIDNSKAKARENYQKAQAAKAKAEFQVKKIRFDKAISRLDKNKDGKVDMADFDPKGTGELSLANFADKDGLFTREQLEQMRLDIEALDTLVELTKNEAFGQVRDNMKLMAKEADKELVKMENDALAEKVKEQAQDKDHSKPKTVQMPPKKVGINTNEVANAEVTAAGPAQTGSVVAPTIQQAEQAATTVMAAGDTAPTPQSLQITNGRQTATAQPQTVGQGTASAAAGAAR